MRDLMRSLILALAILLGISATAQNTHFLELSGNLMHATDKDSVHVRVDQSQGYPTIVVDLPLDSDGYYLGYAQIQSTEIDITTSTTCGSASPGPDYTMNFEDNDNGDTVSTFFSTHYCNGYVDCRGIVEGPNLFGTPCKTTKKGSWVWTLDCECSGKTQPYPFEHFRKKG